MPGVLRLMAFSTQNRKSQFQLLYFYRQMNDWKDARADIKWYVHLRGAHTGFGEIHNNIPCLEAKIIFDGEVNSRLFPF